MAGAYAGHRRFGRRRQADLAVVTELDSLLSNFRNVSTPGSFTNSSFAGRVDFSTGYNAWGVAIGDLDGDGRPDIVFCNTYDNTISIYQNEVPFGGAPTITTQPVNQTVYVGITAGFGVTASGTPPLSLPVVIQRDEYCGCDRHNADPDQCAVGPVWQLRGAGDQCLWFGAQFQRGIDRNPPHILYASAIGAGVWLAWGRQCQ